MPVCVALAMMLMTPAPDVLVAGDGRQIAVAGDDEQLLVLREGEGYALDSLREAAAVEGEPLAIERAPGARCSPDFCALELRRDRRNWSLLVARSKHYVDARQLIAACAAVDVVIAARSLPRSCAPRWLKADGRFLRDHGGLALYLNQSPRLVTVGETQGEHGWWRPGGEDRVNPIAPLRRP